MAIIFFLSAQPGLAVSQDPTVELPIRRVAHTATYAVLTFLLAYALAAWRAHRFDRRRLYIAGIIAALYGVTDEIHQALVPTRYFELEDIALDALGAVAAVVVVLLARRSLVR